MHVESQSMSPAKKTPDFRAIEGQLSQVFKPGTPIDEGQLFRGRLPQIRAMVDTINQTGTHGILYGEPGVGKTSLANILASRLTSNRSILSPHINCDSADTFETIWHKVFDEMQIIQETKAIGLGVSTKKTAIRVADLLPPQLTPDAVRQILTKLGAACLVYVILDEFDKIPDQHTRQLIADTIKLLSDRAVPATVILVGVAEDVNGLIANHQSVERCLRQVPLSRMPRQELEEIVSHGFELAEMKIDAGALMEISGLSKGLPHYAHLLSLNAGRSAIDAQSLNVTTESVKSAIKLAISGAQESIRNVYDKATYSTKKKALYKHVLLACSMADTDERGNFSPAQVEQPMSIVMNKRYTIEHFAGHMHAFCEDDRGPVLKKTGLAYRYRYRFINPLLQPFVLMKGLDSKMITESDLRLDVDSSGQKTIQFDK